MRGNLEELGRIIPGSATAHFEQMGFGARVYLETILTLAARGGSPRYPGQPGDYREVSSCAAERTWQSLSPEQVTLLDHHWSELRDALTRHARGVLAQVLRSLGQSQVEIPSGRGHIVRTVEQMAEDMLPTMNQRPGHQPLTR